MPVDPNIALNVQQPNSFGMLSNLLDMRNRAQEYNNLQAQQQVEQNEAQKQQNMLGEYNNARAYFADPSNIAQHVDANGNLNMSSLTSQMMQMAPTIGPKMLAGLSEANTAAQQAKQALMNTNEQQRQQAGEFLMAQADKPASEVMSNMDAYAQKYPELAPALQFSQKYLLAPNAGNPDAFKQAIFKSAQATQNIPNQTAMITPEGPTVTNQAQTGVMNMKPTAGNTGIVSGTVFNNQIPLSERNNVGVNPITGAYNLTTKDAFGNVTSIQNAPTQTDVYNPQPGDKDKIPELSAEVLSAKNSALNAGVQHENNRLILDNIDNVGATGIAGPGWRNIQSAFGFTGDSPNNSATAYDMVGKALERSALQAAQSMGPQTNAGLAAQIAANGSLHYTPDAIKQITKLNDGIVSGQEAYYPGLQKATSGPNGVLEKQQYDQQWGQNFDPRIFMLNNAIKSGDKQQISSIMSQLGKDGYQKLLQKARNLQSLSQNGKL